jgi:hypothetical protein
MALKGLTPRFHGDRANGRNRRTGAVREARRQWPLSRLTNPGEPQIKTAFVSFGRTSQSISLSRKAGT